MDATCWNAELANHIGSKRRSIAIRSMPCSRRSESTEVRRSQFSLRSGLVDYLHSKQQQGRLKGCLRFRSRLCQGDTQPGVLAFCEGACLFEHLPGCSQIRPCLLYTSDAA